MPKRWPYVRTCEWCGTKTNNIPKHIERQHPDKLKDKPDD